MTKEENVRVMPDSRVEIAKAFFKTYPNAVIGRWNFALDKANKSADGNFSGERFEFDNFVFIVNFQTASQRFPTDFFATNHGAVRIELCEYTPKRYVKGLGWVKA